MSERLHVRSQGTSRAGKIWKVLVVILVTLGILLLCVGMAMSEENVSGFRAMVAALCLNDNNYCLYLSDDPIQYLTRPAYCDKALAEITGQELEDFPDEGTFTANGVDMTYSVRAYQVTYQIITIEEK